VEEEGFLLTGLPVETLAACPICGCTESAPVLTYPGVFMADGQMRIVRCAACSVVYLNPRLTHESTVAVEAESEVYDFSADVAEERIAALQPLLEHLQRFSSRRGRLLDIGCNRGLLLEAARRMGWDVVGIELSPVAAQRARDEYGLEVYGQFEDVLALEPFDLVTAWHVLEHTPDPVAFLRQVGTIMRPDGVLAVQVPSFDFVEEFKRRGNISHIVCEVHTFHFTSDSIQTVFAKAGLEPIALRNDPNDLLLTVLATQHRSGSSAKISASLPDPFTVPEAAPSEHLAAINADLHRQLAEMERLLAAKNNHIVYLEGLIKQIERGRVMRMLRRWRL